MKKIALKMTLVVALLAVAAGVGTAGAQEATGTPTMSDTQTPVGGSYIIVHALNPEGVETASIQGMGVNDVQIYDGDTLIGYGAHDTATHNQPIPIDPGSHTIRVKFNGITLEQEITLSDGETQALIFTFDRRIWDFRAFLDSMGSRREDVYFSVPVGEDGAIIDIRGEPPWPDVDLADFAYLGNGASHLGQDILSGTLFSEMLLNSHDMTISDGVMNPSSYFASIPGHSYCFSFSTPSAPNYASRVYHSKIFEFALNPPLFDNWYVQKRPTSSIGGTAKLWIFFELAGGEIWNSNIYTLNKLRVEDVQQVRIHLEDPACNYHYWGCWDGDPAHLPSGGFYQEAGHGTFTNDEVYFSSIPYDLLGTGVTDGQATPTPTITPSPIYTPTPTAAVTATPATPTASPTPAACTSDMPWWLFPNALLRVPLSQDEKYTGAIVWPPQPWKFGPVTLPDSFKQLSGEYKVEAQIEVQEEVNCTQHTGSLLGGGSVDVVTANIPSSVKANLTASFTPSPFAWTSSQEAFSGGVGVHKTWPLVDFLPPQVQAFVAALPAPAKDKINGSRLELLALLTLASMFDVEAGANGPELSGGAAFGAKVEASVEVDLRPVAYVRAEGKASGSITLCAPGYSLTPQFGGVTGSLQGQIFVWKVTVADWTFIPPLGGTPPCIPPPMSVPSRPVVPASATPGLQSPPIADALITSGPALALDDQGNGLMAWVGLVQSGPALDSTELLVAPVSGGQAGTPMQITSDTHGDFNPQVVPLPDGTYLLTWERTHTASLPDPGGLDPSFLQDLEIAYTRFYPATGEADPPTYLTDNAYLDHAPRLAKSPGGNVLLVWMANPANALVGDSTSPDHLMWSQWLGDSWSAPAEALAVNGALSFDLAYGSTEAAVAFWQVQDSGQSDVSVAHFDGTNWSALQPITADAEEDTAPRLAFTGDGSPFLLWRRDGQLVYMAGGWDAPFVGVGDATGTASAVGQQLATLPDGDLALVWQGVSGGGSDLFYERWFSGQGEWGPTVPLTTDGLRRSVLTAAGGVDGVTVAYLGAPASDDSLTAPLALVTSDADSDGDGLLDSLEVDVYHTDPLNPDTDTDGCADGEELSMSFDPLAWYDVFDVPVPAVADPAPNGARDQVVDIRDVLAVLLYAFAEPTGACGDNPNSNDVDYDCDKNGDTVEDGLDYDRSPGAEPSPPWDAGPPDDVVDIRDVLAALAQAFVVDCSGPP